MWIEKDLSDFFSIKKSSELCKPIGKDLLQAAKCLNVKLHQPLSAIWW